MAQLKGKGITFDFSDFESKMNGLNDKVDAAVNMLASTDAAELASYMKSNRPWTDRTGMAKANLSATVSKPSKHEIRITLAHGVYYGIWLEFAHGKKYAILQPTLNTKGKEVINDFEKLVKKVLS